MLTVETLQSVSKRFHFLQCRPPGWYAYEFKLELNLDLNVFIRVAVDMDIHGYIYGYIHGYYAGTNAQHYSIKPMQNSSKLQTSLLIAHFKMIICFNYLLLCIFITISITF